MLIGSFAEFQHHFGGLWQPATLSYAIEQFFENGGSKAYVVRVVNGARPPTISLRSPAGLLTLVGLNPGSREYLRASVDYDGIAENEPDRFNLVVQRVRSAGSELIQDQEIFRRISVLQESGRWVPDVLAESRLVRVVGAPPAQRPERSAGGPGGGAIGYAGSNPDGDDGGPITDYDVIGSASDRTGMFALPADFNFLCIPPLAREQDVGSSTLLVAARFCRERHAMLIVDPPMSWVSSRTALDAMRTWPFRSDNSVMYFPRVQAFDRLRGKVETFASCGAAAGMIARCDETWPVWAAAETDDAVLRPGLAARGARVRSRTHAPRAGRHQCPGFRAIHLSRRSEPEDAGGRGPRDLRLEVPVRAPPGFVRGLEYRAGYSVGAPGAEHASRRGRRRARRWMRSCSRSPMGVPSAARPRARATSSSATSASTARRPSPRASSTSCSALRRASPESSIPGWSRTRPRAVAPARCQSIA